MPRNELTLSSKISFLDKIQSQPLNTSYHQLAEITGVPKSTMSRVLRQESQLGEELVLLEGQAGIFKSKREGKDPDVEEALDRLYSIISGKGLKNWAATISKQLMVGYRDGKQDTILNLK
ncbi:hypothetical protein RF11_05500 [Thelohanellus kitauei]|uniref:Uncharacterized protein n=1 Tax=Thelohanellus kitauei TaxID=669202 RepID=A0A0C2MJZ6_THEKT|nr:hypothetical protein RF11_05500 [Thelohanellus kitauei]